MKLHVKSIQRNLIILFFFLISPYIGLIGSFYQFFNSPTKKWSIFWIALFFGLMGFAYVNFDETKDIYFYYEFYDAVFIRKSWDVDMEGFNDRFVILLFLGLGYLGLAKNYIGAISAFILYYFLYYLLYKWVKVTNLTNSRNALITGSVLLFFTTTLFSYTGLRFVTAVLIYMLSVLFLYQHEKKKALVWSVAAVLVHFSLLPLVFLLWLYNYVSFRRFFLILPLCFVAGYFIGPLVTFIVQLDILPAALQSKLVGYMVEQEGANEMALWYGSSFWIYQKIYCTVFLFPVLLWKYYRQHPLNCGNFHFNRFILLFYSFLGLCFSYPILLSRYSTVLVYFSVLYLVYVLGKWKGSKEFLYLQLMIVCFLGMVGIFISGNEEYKIFLNPNLLLFTFNSIISA